MNSHKMNGYVYIYEDLVILNSDSRVPGFIYLYLFEHNNNLLIHQEKKRDH